MICSEIYCWHTLRMVASRGTLPDLDALDPHELKAKIVAQHKQLTTQEQRIITQSEQLASRDAEIEHLKLLIAKASAYAVRTFIGKVGSSDRATGTAAGRTGRKPNERIAGARNIGGGKGGGTAGAAATA